MAPRTRIESRHISELTEYANNPRHNDASVSRVAESIRQFGFLVPIIIDCKGEIVAGHTRFKAAKQLGLESVPVIVATGLTDAQLKAFRIIDNKAGESSYWDWDKLMAEFDSLHVELPEFDASAFGFITQFDDVDKDGAWAEVFDGSGVENTSIAKLSINVMFSSDVLRLEFIELMKKYSLKEIDSASKTIWFAGEKKDGVK